VTYRQRRKLDLYGFLGGRCSSCGERDSDVLQIDHVHSDGKKDRHLNRGQLYKKVREEPGRYQLLCANCNWKKRSTDFEVQKRRSSREGWRNFKIVVMVVLTIVAFVFGYLVSRSF